MSSTVIYRLDANDAIEAVGAGWLDFARTNGAPELSEENVVGRRLVEFITSASLQYLWLAVLASVRNSGRRVVVPFRCDSPDVRRYMDLELVPRTGGSIEHQGHLRRAQPRDRIALLHPATPRSDAVICLCSQCKRVEETGDEWLELEESVARRRLSGAARQPRLLHGLCPPCFESLDRFADAAR